MSHYNSIVIGAGHNGLICATYLARKGQRVLVLEAGEQAGGLAATREFHPGFKVSVAHTLNQFSPRILAELQLEKHGFIPADDTLPTVALAADGQHVFINDDTVSGVDDADAQAYRQYRAALQRYASALQPFWHKTMPGIGNNSLGELATFGLLGLKLRLLGREDMLEFLRVATLPMRDLLDEYFQNPQLQAALGWDGLIGARLAPRSPNNAVFALLYRMLGPSNGLHTLPANGIAGLVEALQRAAGAAGVELRCSSPVDNIIVNGDEHGLNARGVVLASGETLTADRVVSSVDPKQTFLQLVGPENLEIEFTNRIRRLRSEGLVAKLHLALRELPAFTGLDRPDGRMIIAPDLDSIEFAFDDAKYGHFAENPVMEVLIPSFVDKSLAPQGQHVLSAHVMYVPGKLKGGWTEEARASLTGRLLERLEAYAPGIQDLVLHAELLTPLDIEQTHQVTGGHWHHTEFAVDQLLMMRPTYEAAQYRTPVPGLFLCGAGCHPGGGLMGGPGYNAAREILK